MTDESKGRQLHAKALKLREEKSFLESLKVGDEALVAYAENNDALGFSELLSMQAKTYLHAYDFTQFKPYLILARQTARAGVAIAEDSGDPTTLALPLFNLAKINEDSGDLRGAVDAFKRAVQLLETHPPERHKRNSVLADFKIHLTTAEYQNGDKTALDRAEAALSDLQNSNDASDYEKHVWISGAHMRIAKMLKDDDREKAREHLMKAKEIIDSDPELVIRKEQWEKLAQSFN